MISKGKILSFLSVLILASTTLVSAESMSTSKKLSAEELEMKAKINELNVATMKANSKNLLEQFDKDNILGVELLIAGPLDSSLMSRFGHAMFRFVDRDHNWMNDYVISFVADTSNDNDISYAKGIFGGYKSMMEIKLFPEFWHQYVTYQKRTLKRYILPINSDIKLKLRETVARMNGDMNDSYYFLSENCAKILSEMLTNAGIAQGTGTIIPTRVPDYFSYHYALPYPSRPLEINTYSDVFKKLANVLGFMHGNKIDKTKKEIIWPKNTLELLENNFSDLEIKAIYQVVSSTMPDDVAKQIRSKHNFRKGATLDQIYQIKDVSDSLYQLCSDLNCSKKLLAQSYQTFGEKEVKVYLQALKKRLQAETSTDHREQYRKKFRGTTVYRQNLNLLLEAMAQ